MSDVVVMWRQFICRACGLVYDEQQGDADSGLAPGTRFDDIPDDWECPLCGVVKADFEPYQPHRPSAVAPPAAAGAGAHRRGVVIVGGGLAGWAVVEALRGLDAGLPITLVTACEGDRYHKPELSIALSRRMDRQQLVRETSAEAAARLGVRLLSNTVVVGIAPALRQLRTTRGALRYTDLVLAQGAKPALPPALPAALCRRVNDLAGWSGLRRALGGGPRRVAVIGAGMVGCEIAEDAARAGHAVTLIDVAAAPLAALLPPPASTRLQGSLEAQGIVFSGKTTVRAVDVGGDGIKTITTADGRIFACDEIVAATGLATDGRLARGAGLDFERGLVVDPQTLRTSAEHIYALGDCISIDGAPCRFIEPLARQASAIGHAILGMPGQAYAHRQPVIRLKTRALAVVVHGLPCADGEWAVQRDDGGFLEMRQWRHGAVVATLEVGTRGKPAPGSTAFEMPHIQPPPYGETAP